MIQVLGFVEDEKTFSNLLFMKNKLQNWLATQIDLCVKMFN
jgi:predicted nucleotidyltransferase